MFPPLYTLFRISPLFSRDILDMAQCIMHTRWGTSTTARLMSPCGAGISCILYVLWMDP